MKSPAIIVFWSVTVLLSGTSPLHAGTPALVSNIGIHIDRQDSGDRTPIMRQYLSLIQSAGSGDEIVLLQKYFRNEVLNRAILNAAVRGVDVTAVYRDEFRPRCEELRPRDSSIDCSRIFTRQNNVHHKSMALHRTNGTTTAIIGSFNLRERDTKSPRAHTALSFDIELDSRFFDFYKAHAKKLLGVPSIVDEQLTMAVKGGGSLSLTFHPGNRNTPLNSLHEISRCNGPLWLSYYHAAPDALGEPVFERLGQLAAQGCDVRILLDRNHDNRAAERQLLSLGVTVHYPNESDGKVTLGHKLIVANSGGQLRLSQSSANLDYVSHNRQHNLTLQLTGNFPRIENLLEAELLRYW